MGAAGSNGLIGCNNAPTPNAQQLRSLDMASIGTCSVCPANLYQNCSTALNSEWTTDHSYTEGVGCKLMCRRIGYNNTSPSCCYGHQTDPYTCDPALKPGNPQCTAPLVDWCANDTNISNPYCTQDANTYNKILKKYCTADKMQSNDTCRNWVLDVSTQGNVDEMMQKYCATNPTDDICCYMNSKIPCPNKFDTRCFNKAAYQTGAMIGTKCPDMLTCNQYINLDPNSKSFASNVTANCSANNTISSIANPRATADCITACKGNLICLLFTCFAGLGLVLFSFIILIVIALI